MDGNKIAGLRRSAVTLGVLALAGGALLAGEEGGYVGTRDEGHDTVCFKFLDHFSYDQYYYSAQSQWTSNNDDRLDDMDIAIFAGHGSAWYIVGEDGVGVDLSTAGSSSDLGFGDDDLEFVAFESCKVVPSPLEKSDWYSNWTGADGLFDGLHQALGFRTNSYQSTDQDVANYFGKRVAAGDDIWSAWFDAIDKKALSYEYGSAVMHPTTDGDSYFSISPDPSASDTSLRIWWQH